MTAPAGSDLDSEVELMELVAGGDVSAFEEFYDRFATVAFSLAMRILNNRDAAADVTQEAFLELWRHRERYKRELGGPRSWLLRIVRNRAIDAYRLTARRGGPPREQPGNHEQAADDNTEARVIARDEARILRESLELLPAEQRTVLNLAYFGGLTQAEIGEHLGLPLGTVKSRIRLALSHLRGSVADLSYGRHDRPAESGSSIS